MEVRTAAVVAAETAAAEVVATETEAGGKAVPAVMVGAENQIDHRERRQSVHPVDGVVLRVCERLCSS